MSIAELPKECIEIIETIGRIKGENHARMVTTIFSMGNTHTLMLNTMAVTSDPVALAELKNHVEHIIGQFIYCFVTATLTQDPAWSKMSEEEQDDKAQRYCNSLQEDVLTLDRKQQEYWDDKK